MVIIGAGMAGLLAANMFRNATVFERQSSLPNNHSAVLRFRSSAVGDILNIPFKKVKMIKTPLLWRNAVADALAYSAKNTGVARTDRSIIEGTVSADRWIAPHNLIQRMAEGIDIKFDTELKLHGQKIGPVISTIPMVKLMETLDYKERPDFHYVSGVNLKATLINTEAYASVLVPHPNLPFSRISVTGNELTIEFPNADLHTHNYTQQLEMALSCLGMEMNRVVLSAFTTKKQEYAKIQPIDDDVRKNFIHWASTEHNIYSLGRFATWRPGLQLDDLINDVRKIAHWVHSGHKYDLAVER